MGENKSSQNLALVERVKYTSITHITFLNYCKEQKANMMSIILL